MIKKFIPIAEPAIAGNEWKYLKECVDSKWVSSKGAFIEKFEKAFARFCRVKYAATVANGTAALHLALLGGGIGKGDEVIVPNLTFVSTANAVCFCGAKPVFVDVLQDSWNIDPSKIEEKITEKTKAIIPVHLYGCPAEMQAINRLAKEHNLFVLEDAAEAHGAEYCNKKTGALGNAAAFSFYGNKIITTGEGGMITSNNKRFIERVNLLKDQGKSKKRKFYHTVLGYNYRLTNLQAAFGFAQLEGIKNLLKRKREIARHYFDLLSRAEGISFQRVPENAKSSYWFVSVLLEKPFPRVEKVASKLAKAGIETRPFFTPLTRLPFYKASERFPVSDYLYRHGLSLPSGVTLKPSQIEFVCRELLKCVK